MSDDQITGELVPFGHDGEECGDRREATFTVTYDADGSRIAWKLNDSYVGYADPGTAVYGLRFIVGGETLWEWHVGLWESASVGLRAGAGPVVHG